MQLTSIEWTDLSSNPLKFRRKSDGEVVWACVKKSSGCASCYSEAIAKRWNRGSAFTKENMKHLEPFLDEKELHKMLTQQTIKGHRVSGSRCFVCDMTDLFGEWVPFELIDRLFAVFALRPDVTWQVLTKWPERAAEYLEYVGASGPTLRWGYYDEDESDFWSPEFPLPNVWLGCSVENQEQADERIPHLLKCPAAVRFLSCEPLLGPVIPTLIHRKCGADGFSPDSEMAKVLGSPCGVGEYIGWNVMGQGMDASTTYCRQCQYAMGTVARIHWVIVGGESGPKSRPCNVWWVRSVVTQCTDAGVPVFVKQLGSNPVVPAPNHARRFGASVTPLKLKDSKGGYIEEWPDDLRVRQFPTD